MALFASYDPSAAAPQMVLAWFDNTDGRFPNLPPAVATIPAGFIAVTPDIWTAHIADLMMTHWSVVNGVVTHAA